MNQKLWNSLHDMFETDDGSLPDIYILNLSGSTVIKIWAYLRKSSPYLVGDACFWHRANEESVPVDAVPNAAELVVNGEAESFHVVLHGISSNISTIPDLGVFVFPDAIYLDYRMGREWGVAELDAFFALLHQLKSFDTNAVVTLPPESTVEEKKRFAEAFSEYGKTAA
jgi:hypothetical protein